MDKINSFRNVLLSLNWTNGAEWRMLIFNHWVLRAQGQDSLLTKRHIKIIRIL